VFIEHFFATAQWVMAGNDTEGLRYANIETPEKISAFDDLSLVELIVERGVDAVKALPEGIRENRDAVAETIENNVRRLIIDDSPINPKYYERMSELLDVLIAQSASNYGIPTDAEFDHLVERLLELAKRQHDY
jgi:type I restriction enzyme R subunit